MKTFTFYTRFLFDDFYGKEGIFILKEERNSGITSSGISRETLKTNDVVVVSQSRFYLSLFYSFCFFFLLEKK